MHMGYMTRIILLFIDQLNKCLKWLHGAEDVVYKAVLFDSDNNLLLSRYSDEKATHSDVA